MTMSGDIHVTPIDDAIEHADSRSCWCRPRIEDCAAHAIVIHRSADGRELAEGLKPATRH